MGGVFPLRSPGNGPPSAGIRRARAALGGTFGWPAGGQMGAAETPKWATRGSLEAKGPAGDKRAATFLPA